MDFAEALDEFERSIRENDNPERARDYLVDTVQHIRMQRDNARARLTGLLDLVGVGMRQLTDQDIGGE